MKDAELEDTGTALVANIQKGLALVNGLSEMLSKPGVIQDLLKRIGTLAVEIFKLRSENADLKIEIGRLQRINIRDKIELNRLKGGNQPADITSVLVKKKK